MPDMLVLGGGSSYYQPDALQNFASSQSAESGILCKHRGRRVAPAGTSGEIVWARLLITGYHTDALAFTVTPYLDGRGIEEMRTFVSRPASSTGREQRFSIILPLYLLHPEYDIRYGLVGSTVEALIEATDPTARFELEVETFLHEPIDDSRNQSVSE